MNGYINDRSNQLNVTKQNDYFRSKVFVKFGLKRPFHQILNALVLYNSILNLALVSAVNNGEARADVGVAQRITKKLARVTLR